MPGTILALELMTNDYSKMLKTIDEALRAAYKRGFGSCTFNFKKDKTFESWVYEYTQDNGYSFQYTEEGSVKISFRTS